MELLDTMNRQGRLRGDTLRPLLHASPDELAPVLGSRLALAAACLLPLAEAARAHALLEGGANFGKIALVPGLPAPSVLLPLLLTEVCLVLAVSESMAVWWAGEMRTD